MAARPATSPARRTRFVPNRPERLAPSSAAVIAVTTCGTKSSPYWLLVRSYSDGSVRIAPAAGNVTSATPWTTPAA